MNKVKNMVKFLGGFSLSAVLLFWLFSNYDYKAMWQVIKNADFRYMTAAAALFFFINLLILWRWVIMMKALNLKFKGFSSVRWFFIGLFCNLFPITAVGGDVVKGMGLAQETKHKSKVFASIVLDRLSGFTGIVLVALLAFLGGHKIVDDSTIMFSIGLMAAGSLTIILVLFSRRIFAWTVKVFARWPKLKNGLMQLHYDLLLMKGKQKEAFFVVFLSALAQIMLAIEFYLTAKGIHQDIPFIYFIIFSPMVCVATALPSIGGLGIREFGWKTLLVKVGVSAEVAVGLSLINSAFVFLIGLLGGLLYVATLSPGRVQYRQAGAPLGRSNA